MRAMCAVSLVVATTLALVAGVVRVSVTTTEHAAQRCSAATRALGTGHGVGPSYFVIGRASIAMSRCSTRVVSRCLLHMQTTSSPSVTVVRASSSPMDALAVINAIHAKRSMRSARAGSHEAGGGCRIFQAPPPSKTAQHSDFPMYGFQES